MYSLSSMSPKYHMSMSDLTEMKTNMKVCYFFVLLMIVGIIVAIVYGKKEKSSDSSVNESNKKSMTAGVMLAIISGIVAFASSRYGISYSSL